LFRFHLKMLAAPRSLHQIKYRFQVSAADRLRENGERIDAPHRRECGWIGRIGGAEHDRGRLSGGGRLGGTDAVPTPAELHVHQHDLGKLAPAEPDRIRFGSRSRNYVMAKALDHELQPHGDDRLVLDDQDFQTWPARNALVARLRFHLVPASGRARGDGLEFVPRRERSFASNLVTGHCRPVCALFSKIERGSERVKRVPSRGMNRVLAPIWRANASTSRRPIDRSRRERCSGEIPTPLSTTRRIKRRRCCRTVMPTSPAVPFGKACLMAFETISFRISTTG